jgi:hypothetical protein
MANGEGDDEPGAWVTPWEPGLVCCLRCDLPRVETAIWQAAGEDGRLRFAVRCSACGHFWWINGNTKLIL